MHSDLFLKDFQNNNVVKYDTCDVEKMLISRDCSWVSMKEGAVNLEMAKLDVVLCQKRRGAGGGGRGEGRCSFAVGTQTNPKLTLN